MLNGTESIGIHNNKDGFSLSIFSIHTYPDPGLANN